jgi:hypothetical protein
VETGEPPKPQNYEDIKLLMPRPKTTVVVPENIAPLFREYKGIGEEIGSGSPAAKRREELKTLILSWARAHEGTVDDESREALIFRGEDGRKLGQYSRAKSGALIFRT